MGFETITSKFYFHSPSFRSFPLFSNQGVAYKWSSRNSQNAAYEWGLSQNSQKLRAHPPKAPTEIPQHIIPHRGEGLRPPKPFKQLKPSLKNQTRKKYHLRENSPTHQVVEKLGQNNKHPPYFFYRDPFFRSNNADSGFEM